MPAIDGLNEVALRVEGMSCEACAVTIREALRAVSGVEFVTTSYENGRTIVGLSRDTDTVAPDLVCAIEHVGYTATLASNNSVEESSVGTTQDGDMDDKPQAQQQDRAPIPCSTSSRAPEVNVLINDGHLGKFELRFTDGPVRIRRDRLVEMKLALPQDGTETFMIERLGIGSEEFTNVPAIAWDPPKPYAAGDAPDGVLTLDAFKDCLVTFQVDESKLVLSQGSLAEAKDAVSYELRGDIDLGGNHLLIDVRIGSDLHEMALTSNNQTTLHFNDKAASELPLSGEPTLFGRVITEKGESAISHSKLALPLVCGGLVLESAEARFSDLFTKPILGIGGLSGFAVTFDPAHRTIRFARTPKKQVAEHPAVNVTRLSEDFSELRLAFNTDKNKTRLVLILSPT